ncbi:PREDICTED: uncharacterized protein LOC109584727 [Amphimedon queenslandica]|uniref:C-terminal of Roc (COR) domain-containing protein n=2 Tax=Amphimedon queenslandica TaxID=400682 RepID=A0AAN0JGF2_AMPQE|nr:PREDICTED: uncharacterized protein LOC109584727 [Amphimedon queenslandica]|eukprot:XP_019856115.1 PREDICTED: uncharacterized protein LOC109584727 [Amphimedon queenslandica]
MAPFDRRECRERNILSQKGFDDFNSSDQSLADKANELVLALQRLAAKEASALDGILCILFETGSPNLQHAAAMIAHDCQFSSLSNYEDLIRSQRKGALREWMKKGSIELTITRVNMLGVPGSGKTCAQLLLLDEDAPTEGIADSTAIACPTVRAVRVGVDDESKKWKRITRDMLMEGLAADLIEASQEKLEDSGTKAASSEGTDQLPMSSILKDSVSSKQIEDDDVDPHAEEVVQEILAKDLTDIRLKGHWLYVIDSGGQPAYQELLPLFTRAASLNIITLDLSKPLDDELDMMYRANGKYFPCHSKSTQLASFKSAVSTAANFKSLDISCITKPHRHSMHLVLGTHYDKVDEAVLNKFEVDLNTSISSLQPYFKNRIIKRLEGSIIFPVTTIAESKEERAKYRRQVCQAIWKSGSDASVTIKIPIQWFAFELSLPEKKSILSFKEVASIGRKYGMKEEDTKEALQYFHDVSLMLYYPEVIDNIVFLDPKPILNILSQLLAITYVHVNDKNALDDNDYELLKSVLLQPPSATDIANLKDGFFHEEIFSCLQSSEVFSQSEFKLPDNLISLLLHLNIITKVEGNEKDTYFIPYALSSYRASKSSQPKVEVSDVQPLLIIWREKKKCLPVPQGLFPLVVMHLLNQKKLKIDLPSPRPDFYFKFRDAMSIQITIEDITHSLHLINHYTHIEIAFAQFSGPHEHCSKIREAVMQAVDKVTDDLHMEHNHANAFACSKDPEKKCYCLVVNKDKFKVQCTDCPGLPCISESKCRCWFKCSTDAPDNTSKPGMTCAFGFGLVILFALAGYLAFYCYSIEGLVIYGVVLGLMLLGSMLLALAKTKFTWTSIGRATFLGAFIVAIIGIVAALIITWRNGGDVAKFQPLLVTLVNNVVNLIFKSLF